MQQRTFAWLNLLVLTCAVLLSAVFLWAQAPGSAQSAKSNYVPPKTAWGDPDLQGQWPTSRMIPLQKRLPGQAQGKAKGKGKAADNGKAGAGPQRPQDVNAATTAEAPTQASLIIDPPDGRIPELTAEGAKRRAEARDGRGFPAEWREEADAPEDMNLYYRCITRGVLGSILASSYNNGNQIIQTPGYVIIRHEMIHETRIIPLDGRPHVSDKIRMYMGDARGHFEGNTLVVETTNMTDKTSVGSNGAGYNGEGGRHSDALKLTERFTRIGPDTIQYEAKLDDPKTWSRPWTIAFPMTEDPGYFLGEYACHEGNYAMENILTGFRSEEKTKR
jgi:hypothetical protein